MAVRKLIFVDLKFNLQFSVRESVLRIRIRILLSSCKNLDSYYFVTLLDFLSLKNVVNVA
jgi:hypothetical protein